MLNGPEQFFLEVIPVSPNRFRPENKLGDQTYLNWQTVTLKKLLELNIQLRAMIVSQRTEEADAMKKQLDIGIDDMNYKSIKQNEQMESQIKRIATLTDVITKWLEIQDTVNCLFDTSKAMKAADREGTGIRQLLERKEGLFRMKMMGKRVNFAARSVISPDPNLRTNELGVPVFMAKKLTFPEPVNEYNVKQLREMVINGPFQHPGANFIMENGKKIALEALSEQQRVGLAKLLLNNAQNKIVYRHLQTGDVVLFNRQPTLHKPSIMSHIVRVLPREQTLRMHYANCKSYNADFDGDEMNLHFLQGYIARAEGYQISLNDKTYINPTNGKPIRELIQDHISSAVYLTLKDTFLSKEQYMQLLYISVQFLYETNTSVPKIFVLFPAIFRPRPLWTGKQLISNIIKIIVANSPYAHYPGLNMESKAKLTADELSGNMKDDCQVIVRDNELLQGVIDKNQVGGGADFGLMHAFHELYGADLLGQLFTALAKLLSAYLQIHGFTCGMDDLMLFPTFDDQRKNQLQKALREAALQGAEFVGLKSDAIQPSIDLFNRPDYKFNRKNKYSNSVLKRVPDQDYISSNNEISKLVSQEILKDRKNVNKIDIIYKQSLGAGGSEVIKTSLAGMIKGFPYNAFTMMTASGAKG